MTTPTISLNSLVEKFPISWCNQFTPNPSTSYISTVFNDLVAENIILANCKSFAGFSGVSRYFHPFADEEGVILDLELICWYFYFDDPFDYDNISDFLGGTRLIERMLDILNTGNLPIKPTPTEQLCQKFRSRALQMAVDRPKAFQRFIAACSDWVKSIIPINRRQYQVLPSLQDYKILRLKNVGIFPEYPLNEIIFKLTLEDSFIDMPEVIKLGELTAWIVSLCNDIYSFESESKHATQMNSLELRKTHGNLSLTVAYQEQVAEIGREIDEFVAIESSLINQGIIGNFELLGQDEPICPHLDRTQYINGMRSLILGNHFWSLNDGRYFSANSPFLELRKLAPANLY